MIALEQRIPGAPDRWELRICKQRFRRLKIANRHQRIRFGEKSTSIGRIPRKYAVKRGQSFRETTHGAVGKRQIIRGSDVTRIEFDGALLFGNTQFPMPK